ncbi:MAG: BON domain-containing protein [Proteobacteria bacterium]|nr:BON domain-containing protein [Pseudomonadota bacterium]
MMRTTNFIKYFFIGLFLFAFVAGCAGTSHKESTGEYVDDSVITAKVKAKIFEDPTLKVLQINVETFKGEVQLSGFVNSAAASARAVQVARSVKGVQSVKNSLIVKN